MIKKLYRLCKEAHEFAQAYARFKRMQEAHKGLIDTLELMQTSNQFAAFNNDTGYTSFGADPFGDKPN